MRKRAFGKKVITLLIITLMCFSLLPLGTIAEEAEGLASSSAASWSFYVEFNMNSHGTAPDSQLVTSDYPYVTEPKRPSADGYTFTGWYLDRECQKKYDFSTAMAPDYYPETLYAGWSEVIVETVPAAAQQAPEAQAYASEQEPVQIVQETAPLAAQAEPEADAEYVSETPLAAQAEPENLSVQEAEAPLVVASDDTFSVVEPEGQARTSQQTSQSEGQAGNNYTAPTTAAYTVEYYKEDTAGSYAFFENESFAGSIGSTVEAQVKEYDGYTHQPYSRTESGVITSDGSLVLKVYYNISRYTVRWLNADGSVLETDMNVKYGSKPEYNSGTPKKVSAGGKKYTFTGWDKEVTAADKDVDYTAVYSEEDITYTVTWLDDNGTVIKTDTVAEGSVPSYTGDAPQKTATAEYTYTFVGWNPAFDVVKSNVSYTAVYSAEKRTYTVHWLDENGEEFDTSQCAYGEIPYHVAPEKSDATTTAYVFSGWTPSITAVTGEAWFRASFSEEKEEYTITWLNDNGEVLFTGEFKAGTLPIYGGDYPEKEMTGAAAYEFDAWVPEVVPANGDAVYTASFTPVSRYYTIIWQDYDGTVFTTSESLYGTVPVYQGPVPARTAADGKTYVFSGWTPALSATASDTTYTAIYTEKTESYTVTWQNYDGAVLQTAQGLEYGSGMPAFTGETPSRPATDAAAYIFAGWTPEAEETVTDNVIYTATFREQGRVYEIIWKNFDGAVLVSEDYEYGATPEYKGETPVKPDTAEATYKFSGWTPEITSVNGDMAYTAVFTEEAIIIPEVYTVSFEMNGHGTQVPQQDIEEDNKPAKPADPEEEGYTFGGWFYDAALTNRCSFNKVVTGNTTLYAKWTAIKYLVSYDMDGHGTSPAFQYVEYGKTADAPKDPSANGWIFKGWFADKNKKTEFDFDTVITANTTVYAKWQEVATYTVTFNANGRSANPASQKVKDGGYATAPVVSASGYIFGGWYEDIFLSTPHDFSNPVTSDLNLYAKWTASSSDPGVPGINTSTRYVVTFNVNGHGSAPSPQSVLIGKTAIRPADPVAEGYTFGGWYTSPTLTYTYNFATPVTATTTLYAKWIENTGTGANAVTYTVSFNTNGKGSAPAPQKVASGKTASRPVTPSVEGYIFGGWYIDSTLLKAFNFSTPITGNMTLYAKWIKRTQTVANNVANPTPGQTNTTNNGTNVPRPSTTAVISDDIDDDSTAERQADLDAMIEATREQTAAEEAKKATQRFAIQFETNGNRQIIPAQIVKYKETATEPEEPVREGYEFGGWFSDFAMTQQWDFTTPVTENLTLRAKWIELEDAEEDPNAIYTVEFLSNGHGVTPAAQHISSGDLAEQPDDLKAAGYKFDGWFKDISLTEEYDFEEPVKEDITLYAKWVETGSDASDEESEEEAEEEPSEDETDEETEGAEETEEDTGDDAPSETGTEPGASQEDVTVVSPERGQSSGTSPFVFVAAGVGAAALAGAGVLLFKKRKGGAPGNSPENGSDEPEDEDDSADEDEEDSEEDTEEESEDSEDDEEEAEDAEETDEEADEESEEEEEESEEEEDSEEEEPEDFDEDADESVEEE